MQPKNDDIYSVAKGNSPFKFNAQVASVFPDMINRSVPGYRNVIKMIEQLATIYVKDKTNCYDLGCSLGEATLAIDKGGCAKDVNILSIDNSNAMLERCQFHLNCYKHNSTITLKCEDICITNIVNASMVVLNYTLQFISVGARKELLKMIYNGMNDGAVLIISEKISFTDQSINQLFINLHHQFKKDNGYSELEICQKRNALENVLIPESLESHIVRLKGAGFKHVSCWQQQLNFASIIAVK